MPLLYALKIQIGSGAGNLFWVLAGTVKLKRIYRPNKNNSERPAGCHSIRGHADLQVLVMRSNALTSSIFGCFLSDMKVSRCKPRRRTSSGLRRCVVWEICTDVS